MLLADDNEAMLDRVAGLLATECNVIGTVADGQQAFDAVMELKPDAEVISNTFEMDIGSYKESCTLKLAGPILFGLQVDFLYFNVPGLKGEINSGSVTVSDGNSSIGPLNGLLPSWTTYFNNNFVSLQYLKSRYSRNRLQSSLYDNASIVFTVQAVGDSPLQHGNVSNIKVLAYTIKRPVK